MAARVRMVGGDLLGDLHPLVFGLLGPEVRPARLARLLALDKTLCGKLLRALRSDDPVAAMSEMPGPAGLSLVLEAVRARGGGGAATEALSRAEAAIDAYGALLDSIPGGRSSLVAMVSGWIPRAKPRGERIAMQTAFRSMAYILGYQAETIFSTHIIQPGAGGSACDVINVQGTLGLRRLRAGTPILAFGLRLDEEVPGPADSRQSMELLDGRPLTADNAEGVFLREFCTDDPGRLKVSRNSNWVRGLYGPTDPPIDDSVSLVRAVVDRDALYRYRTPERDQEILGTVARTPHRVLIRDVIFRDDVFRGQEVAVITRLRSLSSVPGPSADRSDLDQIDLHARVDSLGPESAAWEAREIPNYRAILHRVFEKTGWDAPRFRAYRSRIMYPLHDLEVVLCMGLPEAPGNG